MDEAAKQIPEVVERTFPTPELRQAYRDGCADMYLRLKRQELNELLTDCETALGSSQCVVEKRAIFCSVNEIKHAFDNVLLISGPNFINEAHHLIDAAYRLGLVKK